MEELYNHIYYGEVGVVLEGLKLITMSCRRCKTCADVTSTLLTVNKHQLPTFHLAVKQLAQGSKSPTASQDPAREEAKRSLFSSLC